MNKLLIPTILAATVLVAGIFAFSPIEEASTVHTQIQAASVDLFVDTATSTQADTAGASTTNHDISCDNDVVFYNIDISVPANDGTDDYDIDGNGILVDGFGLGNAAVNPGAGVALTDELILRTAGLGNFENVVLQSGETIRVPVDETDVVAGTAATVAWNFLILANTGTDCTVTNP